MALTDKLKNIADAIRVKKNSNNLIDFKKMPEEIRRLRIISQVPQTRSVVNTQNATIADKIIDRSIETISATDLEGVLFIGDYAFYKCQYLTEVELPASVTEIGKGAFEKCTMLETLTLSTSTPPSLGENAIPYTLKKIRVPSGSNWNYVLWQQYLVAYGGTLEEY